MSDAQASGGAAPQRFNLFFYALSPVHVGSGSALGVVDLPIQRERITDLPCFPGSGLRGALRERLSPPPKATGEEAAQQRALVLACFGQDPEGSEEAERLKSQKIKALSWQGALHLSDARLLCLPVRSVHAGFVWATCPLILARLQRDLGEALPLPAPQSQVKALVSTERALRGGTLLLEDQPYSAAVSPELARLAGRLVELALPPGQSGDPWSWFRAHLKDHLVLLSNEDLQEQARVGTETVTRVRIERSTRTVADGALWTEELLPAESLLWAAGELGPGRLPPPRSWMVPGSQPVPEGELARALGVNPAHLVEPARPEALRDMLIRELGRGPLRVGGDQGIGRGQLHVQLKTIGVR